MDSRGGVNCLFSPFVVVLSGFAFTFAVGDHAFEIHLGGHGLFFTLGGIVFVKDLGGGPKGQRFTDGFWWPILWAAWLVSIGSIGDL